jgi:flagellar basal-body rod protein FlgF
MQSGLYVALSAQMALEKRLDTIADNMANVSTAGFRATGVKFEDLVSGTGERAIDFASAGTNYLSTRPGELQRSGNPFDFAVKGDAWFAIQTPAGNVLTRDGRFTMLDTGELVTHEGYPVLDAGGAPVQLNPAGSPPTAGGDGTLRQDGQLVGAIGLYSYTPDAGTRRFGNSGIIPSTPPVPAVDRTDVGVVQGFVEQSNVNPTLELTRLITVQRNFENVASLIRDSESSLGDAIRTLGSKSS